MKCNICGGELPHGENICKYCGNIMNNVDTSDFPKREDVKPDKDHRTQDTSHTLRDNPRPTDRQNRADAEVYTNYRRNSALYCTKCGRPLDGATHRCVVCDAAEVGVRGYSHITHKEDEEMAKKKKKKNTVRNIIFAIIALIILFTITLFFAFGKFSEWLGIGKKPENIDPNASSVSSSAYTADPNWKAKTDTPKKSTQEPTQTPLPTQKPARTPVPEEKGDPVEIRGGEYLYETNTQYISIEELNDMERDEIKYIYWEIYARHGYTFDNELADYFENNCPWYMPTTSDIKKVESKFNDIEKRNIKTIYDYQKEKGWR